MSAWEEISSTYAEAATKAFPLHRAALGLAGFLVSLAIEIQTGSGALKTISDVPISDFLQIEKGFLSKATGGNLLWGLAAAIGAIFLSKITTWLAYALVDRSTGASKKALIADRSWLKDLSVENRKVALELIESGLAGPRAQLRALASINELLAGLVIVFGVAALGGAWLDGAICVLALIAGLVSHLRTIYIFLRDYFGLALAKAQLQGKRLPKMADFD